VLLHPDPGLERPAAGQPVRMSETSSGGEDDPRRVDRPAGAPGRDSEHNRIGFRNVDEDAEHDEAGRQGDPPREAGSTSPR
jgi:hypothetical protein